MNVQIELLAAANVALLDNTANDVFDEHIDADQLAAFVDDPRHMLAMAIVDGMVVGIASGVEYFHPDKQPQLWINEIGVSEAHQRQGIGRSLVVRLLDEGRSRGCESAWLGTEVDNVPANACYRAVPGSSDPQPFVLYEWELSD